MAAIQTAAAITYAFVDRPAGLPADFTAPAGVALRFLALGALDGTRIDAVLWEPTGTRPEDTTLIVSIHGSGGNFWRPPIGFLGRTLAQRGRATLAINTRQHDEGINTENFFDIRRDIEAAVATARALGFRRLVLQGHSLGNVQVQFYAATDWSSGVRAVVLLGMFADLPWKSRYMLIADEDRYAALFRAAIGALREGRDADVLPMKMGWTMGKTLPVTARHFLTYRSDTTSAAVGTEWIKRIPRPILMVRDEGDMVVLPHEPNELLAAARSEGALVPSIEFVSLPSPKGAHPQAHFFIDTAEALTGRVGLWF
jgi:pimeloyl-ACP methyl ester carboxylesterase